ncbi:hypothetical protein B0I35DRAFT_465304 [Stachybotrys elegans]|uniref:Methyltransferase domain-containing protein n=1 Tax=Stachybotrys elegans TaxID=80388 RepID=A0A8K0SD76_9HYPO|nr:hypothetical protein B0I35DRAFT_465304 [Stachybotrys elegans]
MVSRSSIQPLLVAGVWLRDLQASLPADSKNTYIGTDISPMYVMRDPPPGITLTVQSMKEPWPPGWNGTIDLVHQRMALPAAGRDIVKQVITNMTALLRPGGWIQFVESDASIYQGLAMGSMYQLICDMVKIMDTGADYAPQLEGWFRSPGLINFGCKVFDVPLGRKHPKEELQHKSTRLFVLDTKGMVDIAKSKCSELPLSISVSYHCWVSSILMSQSAYVPNSFSPKELAQIVPNLNPLNRS